MSQSSLDRTWKFNPGDDLSWHSPAFDDTDWQERRLLEVWQPPGFPEQGQMAWYRIHIDANELAGLTQPGLRIGFVRNAYELYANGELIARVGALPPAPEAKYDHTQIILLKDEHLTQSGDLHLAMRVWGGNDLAVNRAGGGPYGDEFLIGNYSDLLVTIDREQIPLVIFSTAFFLLGIYFIYLYSRTPAIKPFLWFGLTALTLALYLMTQSQLKHELGLSFAVLEKIENGSLFIFLVFLTELVWSILDRKANLLLRIWETYFIALTILIVVVPGLDIHYHIRPWWQIGSVMTIIPVYYAIFAAIRAGNRDARNLMIGLTIYVATGIHDLLVNLQVFDNVGLMPVGFLAVAISMAVILANKFSTAVHELESEVADRTAELEQTNTLLEAANKSLEALSRIDPLTGLLNRRGFEEAADIEKRRFVRTGEPIGLVITDIDHFKTFNDTYGHDGGDEVLKRVAELLSEQTRDVDRVARWGGEEFVLLLPGTDLNGTQNIAEKIREKVAELKVTYKNQELSVTLTLGGTVCLENEDIETAINRADEALYRGKEAGRNRVEVS